MERGGGRNEQKERKRRKERKNKGIRKEKGKGSREEGKQGRKRRKGNELKRMGFRGVKKIEEGKEQAAIKEIKIRNSGLEDPKN